METSPDQPKPCKYPAASLSFHSIQTRPRKQAFKQPISEATGTSYYFLFNPASGNQTRSASKRAENSPDQPESGKFNSIRPIVTSGTCFPVTISERTLLAVFSIQPKVTDREGLKEINFQACLSTFYQPIQPTDLAKWAKSFRDQVLASLEAGVVSRA